MILSELESSWGAGECKQINCLVLRRIEFNLIVCKTAERMNRTIYS